MHCTKCKEEVTFDTAFIDDCGLVCGKCVTKPTYHYHVWNMYVGFTDVYQWCECGEKQYVK